MIYDAVSFINSSYNASLGDTPFYAIFGRDRNHPLKLLESHANYNDVVIDSKNRMKYMDKFLQNYVNDSTALEIIKQNRKRLDLKFQLEERVYVPKNLMTEMSQDKLQEPFSGPFEVISFKPPASYVIKHLTNDKERVLHGSKLLPAGKTFVYPDTVGTKNNSENNLPDQMPKRKCNKRVVPPSDRQLRSDRMKPVRPSSY